MRIRSLTLLFLFVILIAFSFFLSSLLVRALLPAAATGLSTLCNCRCRNVRRTYYIIDSRADKTKKARLMSTTIDKVTYGRFSLVALRFDHFDDELDCLQFVEIQITRSSATLLHYSLTSRDTSPTRSLSKSVSIASQHCLDTWH